jgi:hypothetical protein
MVPTEAKLEAVVSAESVVSVALLVAVTLAAVPVVFWFSVGTSADTMARKVGAPEEPLGAARNVFAVWDLNEDKVSVPEVVTGVPVTLNSPVESASETEVTVPDVAGAAHTAVPPDTVSTFPVLPMARLP